MLDWQKIEKTHRHEVWSVVYRILAHEEDAVRNELTRLSESQATAFWLFSVEGLTYAEIAESTESSVNAVGIAIHHARQTLKQRLSPLRPLDHLLS